MAKGPIPPVHEKINGENDPCSTSRILSSYFLFFSSSEVFDGQKSFDKWVSHFENVSAVNGWNDESKLLWLKVRLTGKAHVAYTQLAHEIQ